MKDSDTIAAEDTSQEAAAVPPSARLLLRMVYIMGIVLVLLFLTRVGGIIWKSTRKADPRLTVAPAEINLALPQGTDIRSAEIDGDRLVLNTGREVIVVDLRKNTILSRISAGP